MLDPEHGPGLAPGPRDTLGCTVTVRGVAGAGAREIYLHCEPPAGLLDAERQADALYRAIVAVLDAEGGGYGSVVVETVFLRDLAADLESVRRARTRALSSSGAAAGHRPATTEIEQPPLNPRARLEVSVQAVLPTGPSSRPAPILAAPACGCAECSRAHGLRVDLGDEIRLYAGGLCAPGDAYEQTLGMFALAENLLRKAGLEFRDVVRTWIHLRHMDRDYATFNRARRSFFEARGIAPVPASTGIGGGPVGSEHDLCLGIYAVKGGHPVARTVMTSPTLNEASSYGADFVRGLRVPETNKVSLYVSGTASIDEHGRSVHTGDLDAQADRMLANIAALLERQGARYADVVHAITYLKHPADADRIREKLRAAGFAGFPHALVAAPICRPELLVETEALAVLHCDDATAGAGTGGSGSGTRLRTGGMDCR